MDNDKPTFDTILNKKSMKTSASSEIFDSWTLVTEKNVNDKMLNKDEESDDTSNRVEIINTDDKLENDNDDKSKSSSVEASEDLSDGISIISDSDSVGRLSPKRGSHKHPNSLDVTYESNFEINKDENLPQCSSIHTNCCERSSQTSKLNNQQQQQQQQQQQLLKNRKRRSLTGSRSSLEIDNHHPSPVDNERLYLSPTIRNGLRGFFYASILLAILAFIGKLRYPEWQPLIKSSQLTEMEARLIELELQNNLLRAEFDILSKQVAFVSDRNNESPRFKSKNLEIPSQYKSPNRPYSPNIEEKSNNGKFEKEFKAWPDDIELGRRPSFSCNGNKNENNEKCLYKLGDSLPKDNLHPSISETNKINVGGKDNIILNQESKIQKEYPSPDNFDQINFPQQKNFKPDFKSGHKNGKYSSKKHSGERFDSRENFKRHEKPMKHQKLPDDRYRHQHFKSSGEDFNDSRERRNGNHNQKRNSNFENDNNRNRGNGNVPQHIKDDNNWYIARGDSRQRARTVDDIRNR